VKRLQDKVAIVTGAGQTPGATIGNGRATAIVFAREGARVLLVDRSLESAEETEKMIREHGGEASCVQADVTDEDECAALVRECVDRYGRIDVLHNNVGIGGPGTFVGLEESDWNRVLDTNLKSMFLTCKHVIPRMGEEGSGSIINISSVAAVAATPLLVYKVSKAGVNAMTQGLAIANARYGIRINAIMPGLMDTPMAVEGTAIQTGRTREQVAAARDAQVPLLGKQGTGWDIAHAALFLASDEAKFITGVLLPVDGGQSVKVG
jgi:NAD(P)-dependent dehydrogenase (short-subunit alcohol dehydrogenase family)